MKVQEKDGQESDTKDGLNTDCLGHLVTNKNELAMAT
jgi:hypothetical protein